MSIPFENKPMLVFWETTKACPLNCVHCRAEAIRNPGPGELDTEEGKNLIDNIAGFGEHSPVLVMTGGDPLSRADIYELIGYAKSKGVNVAVSPAVSENLNEKAIGRLKQLGVHSISISLDSANGDVHDSIRQVEGTYNRTLEAIRMAESAGIDVQVNSVVMKDTVEGLPELLSLVKGLGIRTWEVFFIIPIGRGNMGQDMEPQEYEDVCNFLYDASRYGIVIRSVEGPFIRRVAAQRKDGIQHTSKLYDILHDKLLARMGKPEGQSSIGSRGTLDGDGIVFVSSSGDIYPGGFLPIRLGNARKDSLAKVYRENELLNSIRQRALAGKCGICAYSSACGGSRARAYSRFGDPLAPDTACIYAAGNTEIAP
ncbi:TIGR04053 family radical SAM/SPASM domain-containing protein [Candidatus Marsarchaeota archaeon]|nr:TIGR04053 family radical SAM/SPASM domain-containing protein [Candidatus Marsarchaeota archaeon]